MKRDYDKYKEYADTFVRGMDLSKEEYGYRKMYQQLKDEGYDVPSYRKFRGWVLESGKGVYMPLKPSHLHLSDGETSIARLIGVLHSHGLGKAGSGPDGGAAILDHDKAIAATNAPQKYRFGLEHKGGATLKDSFGEYNKELSTSDFSVHTLPNGKSTIAFRGSRAPKLTDMNSLRDWEVNMKAMVMPDKVKNLKSVIKTKDDLLKVQKELGKFNSDDYHFTGYSKGAGDGAGAIYWGEHFGVDSTGINPHISGNLDYTKLKQHHTIIRTTEDPASIYLGLKAKDASKITIKSIPSLEKYESMYGAHELDNFTNDGLLDSGEADKAGMRHQDVAPDVKMPPVVKGHGGIRGSRSVMPKMVGRFTAYNALKKMRKQLDEVDDAVAQKTSSLPEADTLKRFLKGQSTDRIRNLLPDEEDFPAFLKPSERGEGTEMEKARGWRPIDFDEVPNRPATGATLRGQTNTRDEGSFSGTNPREAQMIKDRMAGRSFTSGTRELPQFQGEQRAFGTGGEGQISREGIMSSRPMPPESTQAPVRGLVQERLSAKAMGKLPMGFRNKSYMPQDPRLVMEFGEEAETGAVRVQSQSFRQRLGGGFDSGSVMPTTPHNVVQPSNQAPTTSTTRPLGTQSRVNEVMADKGQSIEMKDLRGTTIPGPKIRDNQYPAKGVEKHLSSRLNKLQKILKTKGGVEKYEKEVRAMRGKYGLKGDIDLEERQRLLDEGKEIPSGTSKGGVLEKLKRMERMFQKEHGTSHTRLMIKRIMELEREKRMGAKLNVKEMEEVSEEAQKEVKEHLKTKKELKVKFADDEGITDAENALHTQADPMLSSRTQAFMAAHDDAPVGASNVDTPSSVPGEDARTLMGRGFDMGQMEGTMNTTELKRYAGSSQEYKDAVKAHLDSRIEMSAQGLENDYARPMGRAIRGGAMRFLSGRSLVAGGVIGAGIGFLDNDMFKNMNQYEQDAITGGATGALTEYATMKLAGQSILGEAGVGLAAGAGKLASSALSGGVGLVIGAFATEGIENMFSAGASPYTKDIVGNIAGGEIGLMGGLGIAGAAAIGGALLSGAGVEGAIAAANAWNPVGWGTAIAAAVTAIAGFFVGLFEGGAEAHHKDEVKKQKAELKYAAGADSVKAQYDYLRTYLTEMGMNKSVIGEMDTELGTQLNNADLTAMSPAAMSALLQKYIKKFQLTSGTEASGVQTGSQMFQQDAEEKTNAANSMLQSVVNRMNAVRASGAAKILLPDNKGQPYDNTTFQTAYNLLLSTNPALATQLGLSPMEVEDEGGDKSTIQYGSSSMPLTTKTGTLSWGDDQQQIEAWEQDINEEGMMKGITGGNYSTTWKALSAEQPALAGIYQRFIDAETGTTDSTDTTPSTINLTAAEQASYIAQWKATMISQPKLAGVMQDLINAANEQGSMLRKPPPPPPGTTTTTDGSPSSQTLAQNAVKADGKKEAAANTAAGAKAKAAGIPTTIKSGTTQTDSKSSAKAKQNALRLAHPLHQPHRKNRIP